MISYDIRDCTHLHTGIYSISHHGNEGRKCIPATGDSRACLRDRERDREREGEEVLV